MFESIVVFCQYLLAICLAMISVIYLYYKHKNRYRDSCLAKIPGPQPRYPLIGNLDLFCISGLPSSDSIYPIFVSLCKQYSNYGIYKLLIGHKPVVVIFKSDLMSKIFSSNVNIDKSYFYKFLNDFMGDGLISTTGAKWSGRRKLLTPAFHLKILNDYIPIINKQTNMFVKKIIDNNISYDRQQYMDIREPISLLTLNIVCETAMGVQMDKNNGYYEAINNFGAMFTKRIASPWIWSDTIFYRTSLGRKFKQSVDTFQSFTSSVIKQKMDLFAINNNNNKTNSIQQITNDNTNNDNYFLNIKSKKSMSFLDLLLDYHINDDNNNNNNNNKFSLDDIRDEVNTFTMASHDTTSASIMWTIYLIGLHPKVQEKIHDELTTIFGSDNDNNDGINRDITSADIQQMVYLDCCIKESLRLCPSAPFIARRITEDCPVGDNNNNDNSYVIPAGVDVFIMIEQMHKNRDIFPDPNDYRPERFQESESTKINAGNYVPFSAGTRSCIGKRFAIMIQTLILSKILLNFTIESLEPLDNIQKTAEMAYRAKSPLNIRFIPKSK
ncbi:cytochrome P450 4C1-like [Oppia nitens]|uniref:cytochrome P450 4C1-like n=1 Tax=Oppia nitens TaxID=1686743 RepID=UPI0023DC05DC|nr:cytochrome P450 4C1-like [Oppia nitens]